MGELLRVFLSFSHRELVLRNTPILSMAGLGFCQKKTHEKTSS
ncbi:hypothetical protein H359_0093 [Chlamydia ibidis 10-1398/6]|uniref:Nef attachable domain protein n=1 Tax=Chlamydia ibidis 10-1398/6 TaxID=1046581 RepID=A0ABN0N031_9CHLA|nr:hypothetical protein H359_0093 [Chlamydia ibidis 10-1398/6]